MTIFLQLHYNKRWEEWEVQYFENGIINEDKTYHTDNKQDAIDTMSQMHKEVILRMFEENP